MTIPSDHRCPSEGKKMILAFVDLAPVEGHVRVLLNRSVERGVEAELYAFVEHA